MPLRMRTPRLRLRALLGLVALSALSLWASAPIWSPTSRLSAQLRPGGPEYLRREAAFGLGMRVPPWEVERAVSILTRTLKDPSPRVREAAAGGLAAHGDRARRAVPDLVALLDDPDRGARSTAAGALGSIAWPGELAEAEVVPPLIRALDDSDLGVRLMAADALVKLGEVRAIAPALVAAMAQPEGTTYRGRVAAILGRVGSNARILTPGFSSFLRDRDPGLRAAALHLLVDHGGPAAVESSLRRALRDEDATIREWAASTMDRLGLSVIP